MVVACFPCDGKPTYGIFNLRAVKALRESVDINVVHLRAWLPGRRSSDHSEVEGIPVTTLCIPQSPWFGANLALYKYLGWSQVRSSFETSDIVHSVGVEAGVLASAWARRARRHHIYQATGSDINAFLPPTRAHYGVAGWETHLHAVACNSNALATAFQALYPGSRNVQTVWRGVDLESFCTSGPIAGPLADKAPVRYAFLGGFPKNPDLPFGANTKGGETLMEAWRAAEDELISRGASLLILGCETPYYDRIRHWRAGLKSPERVHLGNSVGPEMVSAYIRSSDAVLVPSLQEGLPNVAVEASACGRTVFASDVGGARDVVVNGETGVLLPPGDVTAWRDVLVAYAARLSCLRAMGVRARRRMETLFDSANYPLRMLELYKAALGETLAT